MAHASLILGHFHDCLAACDKKCLDWENDSSAHLLTLFHIAKCRQDGIIIHVDGERARSSAVHGTGMTESGTRQWLSTVAVGVYISRESKRL